MSEQNLEQMIAPKLGPGDLNALADDLDRIASDVSKNPNRWRMSIPAQSTDYDLTLARAAETLRAFAKPKGASQ